MAQQQAFVCDVVTILIGAGAVVKVVNLKSPPQHMVGDSTLEEFLKREYLAITMHCNLCTFHLSIAMNKRWVVIFQLQRLVL